MQILNKGTMPNGTQIRIENWNENYDFIPYASTLGAYQKSKVSHDGPFAPRGNELYRFQFDFKSEEECKEAFNSLINGDKELSDYRDKMYDKKYMDCV